MKLQQVATFLLVYQEGSFTAAAIRGHATQSGLSMQIKELEDVLGLRLFERSARGIAPTPAGERFHAHALRLMHDLQAMRKDMAALRGEISGPVTAGIMPTFSRGALAPVIDNFTSSHPLVKLHIVEAYSAVLTAAVARGEVDLAIVPPAEPDPRIQSSYVSRDREMLVTSAATKRDNLLPLRIGDLGPLKLVMPSVGNARRARLDAYLSGIGAQVDAILEMDAMMTTLDLVGSSDWMAILPATLCFPDFRGGPRKVHPLVEPSLSVDYTLITPALSEEKNAARQFADIVCARIREISAEIDALLAR